MKAFARFGKFPGRYELYISSRAERYMQDWEYVFLSKRGKYFIITPVSNGDDAVRVHKKPTCEARTVVCTNFFSDGQISTRLVGKRLPVKALTRDGVKSLVVCLEENYDRMD